MRHDLNTVAEAAMQLPAEDREALIEALIASIEPVGALHPDWDAEIERRLADMDAGRTRFIPADEAMASLTAHIHSRSRTI